MTEKSILSALTVLALPAVFVAARWLCRRLLEPGHLWRCGYGEEQVFGKLRWCYRCDSWAKTWTRCPGSKTACCGNGRS